MTDDVKNAIILRMAQAMVGSQQVSYKDVSVLLDEVDRLSLIENAAMRLRKVINGSGTVEYANAVINFLDVMSEWSRA